MTIMFINYEKFWKLWEFWLSKLNSPKIVITNLTKNYENCHSGYSIKFWRWEMFVKSEKLANFQLLRLYFSKFQIPTARWLRVKWARRSLRIKNRDCGLAPIGLKKKEEIDFSRFAQIALRRNALRRNALCSSITLLRRYRETNLTQGQPFLTFYDVLIEKMAKISIIE